MGRRLASISLLFILIIALSVYGPWDFLGAYTKLDLVYDNLSDGMHVNATGWIAGKEIKNDKTVYYVKDATISCENGTLNQNSFIFKSDSYKIPNKSKVNIEGTVSLFTSARNEGGFDMKSYYSSLGYYFELKEPSVISVSCNSLFSKDSLFTLSERIMEVYRLCLPGEEAGFLASVTIGNKSELDPDLKSLFQLVGVAHVLAVSGLHVSVVCMSLYRIFRKRGLSFLIAGCMSAAVAVMYGALTGGSISAVRAIGMFLIYLLADITGESYDSITALAVMAVMLLLENPLYIKNGSFIFSFSAILGIIFVAQPISKKYLEICNKKKRLRKSDNGVFVDEKLPLRIRIKEWITASLIFSFGITVAMLPIVIYMYYETPLYSILLNLLILPFMPILLGFGLTGGIVGLYMLPLAKIILGPCHILIYFIEACAYYFSKLPFSTIIAGRKHLVFSVVYYIIAFCIVQHRFRREIDMNPRKELAGLVKALVVQIILLFMMVALFLAPSKPKFEIDILDVGQGDGIYICCEDGLRFFIDGGSTSSDLIGKYTMLPFLKYKGASHIDYWFLSHMDLDHVAGVLELLESGYRIDNIVLSSEIPQGETLSELLTLAEINGTDIIYMSQGDICGTKHLTFECVFPTAGLTADDINALSLSLLMKYDRDADGKCEYSGFFGGDIGAEQEQIIAESTSIGHVKLLKVSHHGSRFSSDESFLAKLSPDIAVVSCAKVNRYGHPSPEAIERLENAAGKIYYTMDSGRVRINEQGVDEFVR